jgi:hypothetical protein
MIQGVSDIRLYALREFLNQYSKVSGGQFSPFGKMGKGDFSGDGCYVFTPVQGRVLGIPAFQLKGGRIFGRYPLVTFSSVDPESEIRVQPGKIYGEKDRKRVDTLVEILEINFPEDWLSSLDELKAATEVIKG